MEFVIGNMVCRHCINAVEGVLAGAGFTPVSVELGRAVVAENEAGPEALRALRSALEAEGFELVDDADRALVEQVKRAVLRHVRDERECRLNLSACIEEHLRVSYDTASRVFSRLEGRTIERYHSLQRIELVKELLTSSRLSLAEIADRAGFSSAAHLSRRFKEITGMTPSQFVASGSSRGSIAEV